MDISLFITIFQVAVFVFLLSGTVLIINNRFQFIKRNILLGRKSKKTSTDEWSKKNMILMAFGQKKMFDKPLIGLLHFILYAGFIIINAEMAEIVLDGLTGQHRIFSGFLGSFYPYFIAFFEFLAFLVVFVCGVFILRRNFYYVKRMKHNDFRGWPMQDANNILSFEIVLMFLLFLMNAADCVLQARGVEHYAHGEPMKFFISRMFIPILKGFSTTDLIFIERSAWWLHISGIFSFAIYVTYSKHLHIFLAFPNTYFANSEPRGKFENMESVTKEVKIMLGLEQDNGEAPAEQLRFGAKDVQDLTWKNLMDAYSCTECGRCTEQCPANQTGKKLSPRKIMMSVRDRMEDVGTDKDAFGNEYDDGKSLLGDYISKEELFACTTCNACAEACPININPVDIIMQMRRYVAMEEAAVPDAWKSMLTNVQNNASPWPFSQEDRFNWAKKD